MTIRDSEIDAHAKDVSKRTVLIWASLEGHHEALYSASGYQHSQTDNIILQLYKK